MYFRLHGYPTAPLISYKIPGIGALWEVAMPLSELSILLAQRPNLRHYVIKSHRNPMTYIQQHPNAPYFGETVSFTPMGDHVLVVADSQMIMMTREDARSEWSQNAAQGWQRLA